jgi:hypothetical protein
VAEAKEVLQWTMTMGIFHGQSFGHRLECWVNVIGRGSFEAGTWSWKGLGFPEGLFPDIHARMIAVLDDHIVSRYGVAGELPRLWAGDPDPF